MAKRRISFEIIYKLKYESVYRLIININFITYHIIIRNFTFYRKIKKEKYLIKNIFKEYTNKYSINDLISGSEKMMIWISEEEYTKILIDLYPLVDLYPATMLGKNILSELQKIRDTMTKPLYIK